MDATEAETVSRLVREEQLTREQNDKVSVTVDALPYIDQFQHTAEVDQLILEEMKTFQPQDYLKDIPDYQPNFTSDYLRQEWERVSKGEPLDAIDTTAAITPTNHLESIEQWNEAMHKIQTQLQHLTHRVSNLELMKQFSSGKWVLANDRAQSLQKSLDKMITDVKSQIDAVNRKRKADQLKIQPSLAQLESEWWEYVIKNNQIEAECQYFESQSKRIKSAETNGNHANTFSSTSTTTS